MVTNSKTLRRQQADIEAVASALRELVNAYQPGRESEASTLDTVAGGVIVGYILHALGWE